MILIVIIPNLLKYKCSKEKIACNNKITYISRKEVIAYIFNFNSIQFYYSLRSASNKYLMFGIGIGC